jgi:hypothetical protein
MEYYYKQVSHETELKDGGWVLQTRGRRRDGMNENGVGGVMTDPLVGRRPVSHPTHTRE